MYAIIKDGEKNYKVSPGQVIELDHKNKQKGEEISFPEVVYYKSDEETQVGTPLVEGVEVVGTVQNQLKGDKVTVFKFKRRKGYRRKKGHRQLYTQVKIDKVAKK